MTQASPDTATISLPIGSDADLAWVRQRVRQTAAELGFGLVQQTKLVTAASELARNTLVHGGGGRLEITALAAGPNRGLRLTFLDTGPGIRDLQQAMTDGFTTGGGLGLGLSGAKRLVNEFCLDSRPGAGTTVTIAAWASGAPSPRSGAG
ncbi:ATP-binding protein [Streptomyces caelestis]|jgi:serine/threonine-protein kinase RsbT|uniref:Serine/threonine-protein kinase RsbT n=1 Tax=Streptomyces caelestis TaxID=36816 RepID=A0A7W9HC82_9ACTN|nr:ATP-binding protein [Streptomyces caelestis]MBB5799548.1 serine/threonine-protein kinase RsbT [Streptomyces caelestis]GGW80687.1 anti-sigma regulatory factor [Streptomyces caelestis]